MFVILPASQCEVNEKVAVTAFDPKLTSILLSAILDLTGSSDHLSSVRKEFRICYCMTVDSIYLSSSRTLSPGKYEFPWAHSHYK